MRLDWLGFSASRGNSHGSTGEKPVVIAAHFRKRSMRAMRLITCVPTGTPGFGLGSSGIQDGVNPSNDSRKNLTLRISPIKPVAAVPLLPSTKCVSAMRERESGRRGGFWVQGSNVVVLGTNVKKCKVGCGARAHIGIYGAVEKCAARGCHPPWEIL